jgi:23S rRNA pseudouridine955/2504/2580 synthase
MRTLGLNRMFLHAHALEFTWPDSDETFMVSAPLPDELREAQARIVASGSRSSSKKT